ncbi:MAG: hypothetical protein R3B13_25110 [Polyangiaceae bacterium]
MSATRYRTFVALASVAAWAAACGVDAETNSSGATDSGLFEGGLFNSECRNDDDCDAGQCCVVFLGGTCRDTVSRDPTKASCSSSGSDADALCVCIPPQPMPVCPSFFIEPPYSDECHSDQYVKCRVSCAEPLCFCTADTTFPEVPGVDVPTCPPPTWDGLCARADAGDGG